MKFSGALGLVAVPVLDDALGLAACGEQLEGFLERVADDALEEHGVSLPGTHRGTHGAAFLTHLARMTLATMRLARIHAASNGGERIRTSEGRANGFTARPLWPLGNSPAAGAL